MYNAIEAHLNGSISWGDPINGFRAELDAAKTRIAYGAEPEGNESALFTIASMIFDREYQAKSHDNCSNSRDQFACYVAGK